MVRILIKRSAGEEYLKESSGIDKDAQNDDAKN
jgi:hypothetical protein